MAEAFRVGVTRDFVKADGTLGFGDIGLGLLDAAPGVEWEYLAEDTRELRPDQIQRYDGLLALLPKITEGTLLSADRLAIIARWGVGYDSVDIETCAKKGVAVTITPDGVRRPVAVAAITFLLALTHKLRQKDALTREGRWSDKLGYMGMGVTGRTLGLVGLGNIGREVFTLAKPFGMRHLAYDPYVNKEQAEAIGVELVDLETLLRRADYVCITCALTPETYHLIDATQLAQMQPHAYLINVARGPIVHQQAMVDALRSGRIQGAATDVYETEPPDPDDPLMTLDNVLTTPHAICWTDEFAYGCGASACESILEVAAGRAPKYIVNRAVTENPLFQNKLKHWTRIRGA